MKTFTQKIVFFLPQSPASQEFPWSGISQESSSSSSENKTSSSSTSSKPRNVEASLSDEWPNISSGALSFLPIFFTPPLPATMKTSASEQHRQVHTLSQLYHSSKTWHFLINTLLTDWTRQLSWYPAEVALGSVYKKKKKKGRRGANMQLNVL